MPQAGSVWASQDTAAYGRHAANEIQTGKQVLPWRIGIYWIQLSCRWGDTGITCPMQALTA